MRPCVLLPAGANSPISSFSVVVAVVDGMVDLRGRVDQIQPIIAIVA